MKKIITDEEIEAYALANILDADSVEAFANIRYWQEGAKWMRDILIEKNENKKI